VPIYEYTCPRCGDFEHLQTVSAKALARCPNCRSKVTKLVSASSFRLKGGGWYADGYQKSSGSDGTKDSKTPAASASSSKAETKPEATKSTESTAKSAKSSTSSGSSK